MLFRPSFCAHCGEKIDRIDWGLFTSRRFCVVCETEFKGHDLIPRVIVPASLLIGAFGVGAYLKSGTQAAQPAVATQERRLIDRAGANANTQSQAAARTETRATAIANSAVPVQDPKPGIPQADLLRVQKPVTAQAEAVYICGAATKKGTPCSRRVKGNVRCFQHLGMPAMLPPDKLRIN